MNEYLHQTGKVQSYFSRNDIFQLLFILLLAKFFKSSGIYLFYDLLKHIHVVQLLFFATLLAAFIYLLLQRPFSDHKHTASYESNRPSGQKTSTTSKKITKNQWFKIFKYSALQTIIRLAWLFGLTQCGPLRTTLIFEQSEFVILCVIKSLFLGQTSPSRIRGIVLLISATVILVTLDYDSSPTTKPSYQSEGNHHGLIANLFYFVISFFDVSDHKAGVLLLVITLLVQTALNQSALSKVLATDLGGSKRLRALSLITSAIILFPWAIFNLLTSSITSDVSESNVEILPVTSHSWLYFLIPVFILSIFTFVIEFYVDSYVSTKTDQVFTSKLGALFVFTCSVGLSFVWNHPHLVRIVVLDKIKTIIEEEHRLSWGVFTAYALFCFSTEILTQPLAKNEGSFIGYSSVNGNPLYSLTGEGLKKTSMSMFTVFKNILREVLNNKDSRGIFYFLCINLVFCFVELSYGVFTNSLGLISDGIHMFFDCSALVMGLAAAVISQWKPTKIYSYGFGRFEILSGYVNGLFLVVISIFVFFEALTRLFSPPEIQSTKLIYVSLVGLCVNLFGIFAFRHAHTHGGLPANDEFCPSHNHGHSHNKTQPHTHSHAHDHSSHSHSNENMTGVYLHILADTLGSVGVIISSILIQQFGWYIADPLCSLAIAIMIFVSVIPLLKHTSSILLLRTPGNKHNNYKALLERVLDIEGVSSYRDDHLWELSSTSLVSTLHVQIENGAYEQLVSAQITGILKEMKLSNLTVQLEKEVFFEHLAGLGAHMGQMSESNRIYKKMDRAQGVLVNVEKFV